MKREGSQLSWSISQKIALREKTARSVRVLSAAAWLEEQHFLCDSGLFGWMTHSPRRSKGLWYCGDLADQSDRPLAGAEPICSCTDVDGWLMPSGRSQEVIWVLLSCLSTLVQVVCKHPYLVRLGWYPLVDESESILFCCCLIHKLSWVPCLASIFFRTATLSYSSYRKFVISQVSYCVEETKKKKLPIFCCVTEAKYTAYNFMFQRPSLKNY